MQQWTDSMKKKPLAGPSQKILSWNIAGLRAYLSAYPDGLQDLLEREAPDVLCLQETKLQDRNIPDVESKLGLTQFHLFWSCSTAKLGYSGTLIASRIRPVSVQYGMGDVLHDRTGRLITLEFADHFIVGVYTPNSGSNLQNLDYRVLEWDVAFAKFLRQLESRKPVIVAGDLNIARSDMDVYDPKRLARSSGFTIEERTSFETKLIGHGFIDTFRELYPDITGYTFFSRQGNMRASGRGWKLDYFLISECLRSKLYDSYIITDEDASDHSPIVLVMKGSRHRSNKQLA